MTTLYISGASRELERAKRNIAAARALGYEITLDWTESVDAQGGESDGPRLTLRQKRGIIEDDIRAATRAEVFWLLHPSPGIHTAGAWCELSAATYGAGPRFPVAHRLVSGVDPDRMALFAYLGTKFFHHDHQVLGWLQGYRQS